jgi:hypothetical protein
MLRVRTLPGSLSRVLDPFRSCFTTPTFATFVTLLAGMIARPAHRTVCGMLACAGLAGVWHHSRAHRFFATARWHPDRLGLTVLRLIVGHLVPVGAPLTVAVDDTLFRRSGRKVYAARGDAARGLSVATIRDGLAGDRGNTCEGAAGTAIPRTSRIQQSRRVIHPPVTLLCPLHEADLPTCRPRATTTC